MIFEASIKTTATDNKGCDKIVTSRFIVENAELFGEVENKLYTEFGEEQDFEVTAIKISKLKEIINEEPKNTDSKIYFATIVDKFYIAEKDEYSETQYVVALFASNINEAYQIADNYMKQGLEDMELVGIKCTKIVSVLR